MYHDDFNSGDIMLVYPHIFAAAATIQTELSATSIAFIVLSLVLLFCVVPITFACGYLQGYLYNYSFESFIV